MVEAVTLGAIYTHDYVMIMVPKKKRTCNDRLTSFVLLIRTNKFLFHYCIVFFLELIMIDYMGELILVIFCPHHVCAIPITLFADAIFFSFRCHGRVSGRSSCFWPKIVLY